MRYLGLLKWFDEVKGFGKIGTSNDGDIFIHQKDFAIRPWELLKATPLLFIKKNDNQGRISAINAEPPNSYEDFKTILSYLNQNPTISIEITRTGYSERGNQYKRNEFKPYNLVEHSLHQLLLKKNSMEVFEFFKQYFDETYKQADSDIATKYFSITKIIKGFNFELYDVLLFEYKNSKMEENDVSGSIFLIQKLFRYYLDNSHYNLLYKIWKNNSHKIYPNSYNWEDEKMFQEIIFEFPPEVFLNNFSDINSHGLNKIITQSNGIQIIRGILDLKILNMESISKQTIDDILESIQLLSQYENINELKDSLTNKLLDLISKCDFINSKKENTAIFKIFLEILTNPANNLNYDKTIQKFNGSISSETMFILWQETKYFQPENIFFETNFSRLSYIDFLNSSNEFHEKYFSKNFSTIEEFQMIENFGLLTFLIVESPCKKIQEIFPMLSFIYQAAYWLNFPKEDNWSKSYAANYEISDIPFKLSDFIFYFEDTTNLNELLLAYDLTNKIQKKYKDNSGYYSPNIGFFELDKFERLEFIQNIILKSKEASKEIVIELFKIVLNKCKNEEYVLLCKSLIPKLIQTKDIELEKLTEIILNINIEKKYKYAIFSHISIYMSKYDRTVLWLKGYINELDFNDAIEVFDRFELNEQPQLFRKLFSLIQKGKVLSNNNFVTQLFTLLRKPNINLDVRVCIAIITSLENQYDYIGENILSEIVCKYVNENVSNLVQFYDMFQECRGRTWMTKRDESKKNWYLSIQGFEFPVEEDSVLVNGIYYSFDKETKCVDIECETYSFKWVKIENNLYGKLYEKPIGITFCDAVKSMNDETLNRNFYWCCNSKCYAPCQTDHNHLEWGKYSLRDFIKILNLPFEDDKYYRFVSLLNRSNRLMKKLKCNTCNHLLRDSRTSQFAFHRVTSFHCTNPECSKLHEVIYLNHCLNWKCLNVVDSRISVTCPNGWYICDSCDNCCSQKKLVSRLDNLITNNAFNPNNSRHLKLKNQVDNNLGHQEREEKFNYRTGERINNGEEEIL